MTEAEALKLIESGESNTVEFKKSTKEITKDIYDTVCAFSNRAGGHIFLGISDDGLITGVLPGAVEKLKKDFVTAVNNANKLYPPLYLSLEEIQIDGLIVLHQVFAEGDPKFLQLPDIFLLLIPGILRLQEIQEPFHIAQESRLHPVRTPVSPLPLIIQGHPFLQHPRFHLPEPGIPVPVQEMFQSLSLLSEEPAEQVVIPPVIQQRGHRHLLHPLPDESLRFFPQRIVRKQLQIEHCALSHILFLMFCQCPVSLHIPEINLCLHQASPSFRRAIRLFPGFVKNSLLLRSSLSGM